MTADTEPIPRRRSPLPLLLGLLFVLAGGGLVGFSMLPGPVESAPLPAPFKVEPRPPGRAADPFPEASGMRPGTLRIPSLSIDAPLVPGGITEGAGQRTLEIPDDPGRLTLYEHGAAACDSAGTVLVAGHVSSRGTRGALWPLAQVQPHAEVYLACADGAVSVWEVIEVAVSAKAELPQGIFTGSGRLRAELVTCGGPVLPDGHYRDNVRVELERIALLPAPGIGTER